MFDRKSWIMHVPGSKLFRLGMVVTMLARNPYNELNPYSWVDDHSLGKGTNESFEFTPQRWKAKGGDSFPFWANGKRPMFRVFAMRHCTE